MKPFEKNVRPTEHALHARHLHSSHLLGALAALLLVGCADTTGPTPPVAPRLVDVRHLVPLIEDLRERSVPGLPAGVARWELEAALERLVLTVAPRALGSTEVIVARSAVAAGKDSVEVLRVEVATDIGYQAELEAIDAALEVMETALKH